MNECPLPRRMSVYCNCYGYYWNPFSSFGPNFIHQTAHDRISNESQHKNMRTFSCWFIFCSSNCPIVVPMRRWQAHQGCNAAHLFYRTMLAQWVPYHMFLACKGETVSMRTISACLRTHLRCHLRRDSFSVFG